MDDAIRSFWQSFRRLEARLVADGHDLGEAYDVLLEDVQKIDPGLYLEMGLNEDSKELIVTAEGKKQLFPLVDDIVRAAPKVDGWTFLSLKPRLGFPKTVSWEDVEVRIADVWFKPLFSDDGGLAISLHVADLDPETEDDVHNALLRAIDHGLGERAFAEQIEATFVENLPDDRSRLRKLTDLESYLNSQR